MKVGARANGDLSPEFTTRNAVHEGCPISPLLSNFVIEMITKIGLSLCENSGIDIRSDRNLSDFEYAEDVLLLSEDPIKL